VLTLLVVLAVAAILFVAASVATQETDVLVDAPPDGADLELPAGRLFAEDLRAVRFGLVLRGYRMSEVDAVLERLGEELAFRDERIADLERVLAQIVEPVVEEVEAQAAQADVMPLPAADEHVLAPEVEVAEQDLDLTPLATATQARHQELASGAAALTLPTTGDGVTSLRLPLVAEAHLDAEPAEPFGAETLVEEPGREPEPLVEATGDRASAESEVEGAVAGVSGGHLEDGLMLPEIPEAEPAAEDAREATEERDR